MAGLMASAQARAAAAESVQESAIGALYGMRSIYQAKYAPADWKKAQIGYDLETQFQKSLSALQANPALSVAESRSVFSDFIYAMKDYHVSIKFLSTEAAKLPFTVRGAGDRYFIVDIDRAKLPENQFPFSIGDEIVGFGGLKTADAVAALQAQLPTNVPETDRAVAENRLTDREAARGLAVPKGPLVIDVLSPGSPKPASFELIWDYTPERISQRSNFSSLQPISLGGRAAGKTRSSLLNPVMSVDNSDATGAYALGARKAFTPDLGAKIWESADDSAYYAYISKLASGKLIGYARIASWVPKDDAKAGAEFAALIGRFEAVTDALVIDQVNNPGGSIFHLYNIASMLADKPLKTPRHRMSVAPSDVAEAIEIVDRLRGVKNDEDAKKALASEDFGGAEPSYEKAKFLQSYAQFLIDEWNAGKKLTSPYWVGGVDQINPGKVHYSKPILLLINHLDFSGGDFFPAIMQDNHRATVMGSRTAGAGGYVNDVIIPNDLGIRTFRVTESIAERMGGNPIENLGVVPDVTYEFTADDFTDKYAPYAAAIEKALNAL
jgi:hypothetical protein